MSLGQGIDLLGFGAFKLQAAFRLQGLGSSVCEVSQARICRPARESALSLHASSVCVTGRFDFISVFVCFEDDMESISAT